ncbi:MAG: LysE family translocator [Pseudomonadota bacterium]
MSLEVWLAFAAASAVLVAIPGPTVMLVVGYALGEGRRSVLATAPGVALGDVLAMTGSMLGVGAVLAASSTLFSAVKLAGAAYLIWLGWRMWRSARDAETAAQAVRRPAGGRSGWGMFRESFVVTLLNPKGLVFFVAFVPQFIDPAAPLTPLTPQLAILICTFTTLGFLNAVLWGLAAGEMRARIATPSVLRWTARAGGGCLIGAGTATALAARG